MPDGQIAAAPGWHPAAPVWRWVVAGLAVALIGLAGWRLAEERQGLERVQIRVGDTPATLTVRRGAPSGPLVVIAHGFAGSRQFMEAYALTLARAGYATLAYDALGHGRNPVPISGDVSSIDGTTRLLMDELAAVIDAGLSRPEIGEGLALLAHSMMTDVVVREALRRDDVDAIVGLSLYSEAVTGAAPRNLLMIAGQGEPHLREAAVAAMDEVRPGTGEGETVREGDLVRRAVVAPGVEHVGILYSGTALREARDWLDAAFGRQSDGPILRHGPWVAALLAGIVLLAWPLAASLPQRSGASVPGSRATLVAVLVPALTVPVLLRSVETSVLPVLVADYLALHLGAYGLAQLALLRALGVRLARGPIWPGLALAAWGIGVFGLALDQVGASFVPNAGRWPIIGAVALGALPFMLGDAVATAGGAAPLWQRLVVRAGFLGSLALAVALDFEGLFFLVLIIPIILLFFLLFGTMGGWVGRRAGPLASGLGLGLVLAWSIGVSFPLFAV